MRVLTVVSGLGLGGTERAAENFAIAYERLGHESMVLSPDVDGLRSHSLRQRGIPVVGEIGPIAERWSRSVDVVHLHAHGLDEVFVRELKGSFPSAVFVAQNVFAEPTQYDDVIDVNFQLSRDCARRYRLRGGMGTIAVVPNPVDSDGFVRSEHLASRFKSKFGIQDEVPVVLRIGQPITYKWSPLLVRSFEQVLDSGLDAHLVLVGSPPEVLRQAQRSHYAERITSVPRLETREGLVAAYSAGDLFAHAAAQGESFGYVLAEAMLCEVPVLTLDTPWADNSQGEILHGFGRVAVGAHEYRREMMRMLSNEVPWSGEAARTSVIQRFGAVRVAARALEASCDPRSANLEEGYALSEEQWSPRARSPSPFLVAGVRARQFLGPKILAGGWRWLPEKSVERARTALSRAS